MAVTRLGCIADDFTGATDLAGILARSGADVSLRIATPAEPDDNPSPFEVIALKCRTAPVEQAIAETTAALRWLQKAGAQKFFWKYCSTFDSTPHGNIGPVAENLMAQTGTDQTIYCPAFPQNGRTVYKGHLFVGDLPLSESPMKYHPLTPMTDSSLARLLEQQVSTPVGLVNWQTVRQGPGATAKALTDLSTSGIRHVITDALTETDLETIARASWNMPLITGGSALALALPELFRANGLLPETQTRTERPKVQGGQIVLSGSCSAMTRSQVARYTEHAASHRLDPLALARDGSALEAAHTWLSELSLTEPKIIYATAEPEDVTKAQEQLGRHKAGEIIEQALADLSIKALDLGIRRFVVAGGETSGAVTQALDANRLRIGAEIAPGVPWTFAVTRGEQIALALKSGNFGDENFFATALEILP